MVPRVASRWVRRRHILLAALLTSAAGLLGSQAVTAAIREADEPQPPIARAGAANLPDELQRSAPHAAANLPAGDARLEPTFFESVNVDLVSVDVFVTDRLGKPVLGLRKEDFSVFEDGKPVAVTHFFGGMPSGQPPVAAAPAGAGAAAASMPDEGNGDAAEDEGAGDDPDDPDDPAGGPGRGEREALRDQGLVVALLIDNRSLQSRDRNRLLPGLLLALRSRLDPTDRVLVASYDGGLRILLEPTGNRAALAATLGEAGAAAAHGLDRSLELRRLLQEIQQVDLPGPTSGSPIAEADESRALARASQLVSAIRHHSEERFAEVRETLATLAEFIDSLSGLPGRKALIYLSGRLPLRPGAALFQSFENRLGALAQSGGIELRNALVRNLDATPLLAALVQRASADRVSVYTLSAAPQFGGLGTETAAADLSSAEVAGEEGLARHDSMRVAGPSGGGGTGFSGFDPAVLLERMHRDLKSHYSLGFTPPHPRDGKDHRIEVRARDRALVVRHRPSYRDRPGEERTRDRTTSALLFGVIDNPLGVALELGPESRIDGGQARLEVTIRVPITRLALLPQDRFHEGRLTVFLGTRNRAGGSSKLMRAAVPIRIPNEQLLTAFNQVAAYHAMVILRPEETSLAVGVRDELGQTDSTVRAFYTPGQTAAGPER